ncbi:MAG: hypothetical protein ABI585_06605 [Betaproteobacteria bacterium]
MSHRWIVAALAAAFGVAAQAQAPTPVMQAGSATYRPAASAKAMVAPRMRLEGAAMARRVELARPTAAERAKLVALNRGAGSALAAPGTPQFIGFGRDVAAAERRVDLSALTWTTLADGAKVARIEVASAGAAGLRVAVRLPAMHPDVTVRFGAATSGDAMVSVPANTVAQATARFGEYWSPVIDGERVAIEIEAAAGVALKGATLEIARVSHLVVGASSSRKDEAKILADIGDSGSCNIDFHCVDPQDAVTLGAGAGTGKLVFTVPSGGTARCTGTLLNDIGTTFTPYIFSANHCFQGAYEAFTLNVWWFFDSNACGSNTPGSYQVQTGGAMLLGRSQDWDWALMRMNSAPPTGVSFRGWDATNVVPGTYVEIFHHPSGDLKKWSQGHTFAAETVDFGTAAGGAGFFTRVVWEQGTTEGGSSGGGLTSVANDGDLVERGGLLGGDALCVNPEGSDFFSQFGAMLPLVRQYLTPALQVPGLVVSVEFYHGNLNHFFMTIDPAEIQGLDTGVIAGWERTGFRFLAYTSPGPGRNPVCRFYRKPEFGDSHFFSADPAECSRVAVDFATEWVYENPAIYYVELPNTTTGGCPAATKPIYRFLNTIEINHRYTTEQTVANTLSHTPGWIAEGYGPGPLYPVMCSPVGT